MTDADYFPNDEGRDRKCPLCGSPRTSFAECYSDDEEIVELSFSRQECANGKCGLPCRLWETIAELAGKIERLQAENLKLQTELRVPHPARDFVKECNELLAAQAAEIARLERLLRTEAGDWADMDTEVRKQFATVLEADEVYGNSDCVPPVEELAAAVAAKYRAATAEIERLRSIIDERKRWDEVTRYAI